MLNMKYYNMLDSWSQTRFMLWCLYGWTFYFCLVMKSFQLYCAVTMFAFPLSVEVVWIW